MGFRKQRNYFKIIVCVLLVIGRFGESEGVPAVKIKNITVQDKYRDGCRFPSVTIKWMPVPFFRNDSGSFKIWLTSDVEKFTNVSVLRFRNQSVGNLFTYTFASLAPAKKYTVHIESYTSIENMTSYANSTFDVGKIICYKGVMLTNYSAERGYLVLNWRVPEKYRSSSTPVVYNISLCPRDVSPVPCNSNLTRIVCKATYHYNGSASSGEVKLYEKNWQKFVDGKSDKDRPLYKAWNKEQHLFTCGIYLGACLNTQFKQHIKYDVDFGDGRLGLATKYVEFQKGFSYKPEFINISFVQEKPNLNEVKVQVHWRFRPICEQEPAHRLSIKLSGKTRSLAEFQKYDLKPRSDSGYIEDVTPFTKLVAYSMYNVQFLTESRVGERRFTTRQDFKTPEGVPVSAPTMLPILGADDVCIENKRNVTVKWKLPPKEDNHGIIRNITLRYFPTNSEKEAKKISMANVLSTEIIGLYCDVSYKVQVQACLHANKTCSKFSKPQVIQAKGPDIVSENSRNGSIGIVWWVTIGVGVVFIFVAVVVCQYYYRKKRRSPLPMPTEPNNAYVTVDNTELSQVGEYLHL